MLLVAGNFYVEGTSSLTNYSPAGSKQLLLFSDLSPSKKVEMSISSKHNIQ